MKKFIIPLILLIFLVGIASAGYGNGYGQSYGQYKNGIGFQDDVNINDFTVEKNQHQIRVQSNTHYETSIKVPYSELENLEGFSGKINIIHFTDGGINDWSKTIIPINENGYCYLDLEFSEVTITAYQNVFQYWDFENWSAGTSTAPDGWYYAGGSVFQDEQNALINDYCVAISNSGSPSGDAAIQRHDFNITYLKGKNITAGAWIKSDRILSAGYWTGASVTIYIDEGSGYYEQSGFYSGTGNWEYCTVSAAIPETATSVIIRLFNRPGDPAEKTIYFDGFMLSEGDQSIIATETISDGYANLSFTYAPFNTSEFTFYTLNTQFEGIDLTDTGHGKIGSVTGDIDGTPITPIRTQNNIIIPMEGLSETEHTFNVSVPYNLPPILYSPTNGSTIERVFPPLYDDVTFSWEDTGTTCQIQVAEDTSFSNVVYSGETTSATKTISLAEGTYYWRVRSYDSIFEEYGEWPDTYNFVIVSTSSTSGNGVHGVVFEAESLGSSIPLSSALVTIYNDTYSDTAVTGPEGYYQFPVANGTYIVYASLSGYDSSALLPVNVSGGYTILNIPLRESDSYFAPQYVRFVVTDSWYWERYVGATVTVYEGESTTALFTETTGTDGAVGFELSENVKYRIVTTYGDITQTDYITPTETTYYIVLEDIETSLLPENQFYDVISINITKTEINSTNGEIAIQYNDTADSTNSVYFVLGQSYNNGTLNILDTSATYNGNCSVTFDVTGYLGQSYIIKAVIDHDDFGTLTKYYSVDFPSNTLPFTGKGVVYLCIIILFVVAAQFGRADNSQGAILLCGLTWFMWGMDIFVTFGESVNSLIGVGLGISTTYALLAYINKKRNEEGI